MIQQSCSWAYIYTEKTLIKKHTCTPMFIVALFTIAKTWKQPKCPSIGEWIKKMWYKHTRNKCSPKDDLAGSAGKEKLHNCSMGRNLRSHLGP